MNLIGNIMMKDLGKMRNFLENQFYQILQRITMIYSQAK